MRLRTRIVRTTACVWVACALCAATSPERASSSDQPQWGEALTRNQVSEETGLPDTFDPVDGTNIRWSIPLGSDTYSTPIVARGRVFIGTNNQNPRDARLAGDRGVLLCLDERDGRLHWQLATPRRGPSFYWDWPRAGVCSPVTVEGDRVYAVTNRGEVVCLDIDGLADGNDGPFTDEGALIADPNAPPLVPAPGRDADVLWLFDYTTEAEVRQHDGAHCSILVWGRHLYINTSNGLNDQHDAIGNPDAPSLIVLDKISGRFVAREREGISRRIFHSTWSSPALANAHTRPRVLFGGGDGVLYGFHPVEEQEGVPEKNSAARPEDVPSLRLAWRIDCDPEAPKDLPPQRYIRNREVSPSNIKSMPVVHGTRVYVTYGGDVWWGKRQCWLKCIELATGDDRGAPRALWSCPLKRHCMSTSAVRDGLVYAADCSGTIHCVDAATGRPLWTHDAEGEIWASPLVADGRLYVGTRRGVFWILKAGRIAEPPLARIRMDSPVHASAIAANGVLYVATMKHLYAIERRGVRPRRGDGSLEIGDRAQPAPERAASFMRKLQRRLRNPG